MEVVQQRKKKKEVGKRHVFSLTTSGALFIFYKYSTNLVIYAMKFWEESCNSIH